MLILKTLPLLKKILLWVVRQFCSLHPCFILDQISFYWVSTYVYYNQLVLISNMFERIILILKLAFLYFHSLFYFQYPSASSMPFFFFFFFYAMACFWQHGIFLPYFLILLGQSFCSFSLSLYSSSLSVFFFLSSSSCLLLCQSSSSEYSDVRRKNSQGQISNICSIF